VKLIGLQLPGESGVIVARLEGELATLLAPVEEFWSDSRRWAGVPGSDRVRLGDAVVVPPVRPAARVLCVGLNYRSHVAEGTFTVPDNPVLFGRWTASLTVGGTTVPVPSNEDGLDWEGEVAAWVGEPLRDVDADAARAAVFGYSTFNDLSARKAQRLTHQWTLGKNADLSGPIGPLVTADEVGDLRNGLHLTTRVNGITVQDGNTRDMIFEVGVVLALASRTMTLEPGDILATGTPEGVGAARTPPWLLHDGDVVEVEVERLGVLTTPIGTVP
jgi:2-keto-4-pentenoate hydratase/2-oxohepta-3-ene-1,7-dioic acid hydratase in catechol pathway